MSKIEFVSHETFPEDEYTKELVYLALEGGKYRVAYVRKSAKNGGLFWSVASVGATRNGQKEFFPTFIQDSNFLEKDIKDFLDKRKWESAGRSLHQPHATDSASYSAPRSMDEVASNEQLPF